MPRWIPSALLLAFVGTVFWLERRKPLRPRVDPGPRRVMRNLAVAGITAATVTATERPVIRRLTEWVDRRGSGLVPNLRLPNWLAAVITVVLLDYTLYLWHILLHRVPLLWRFHLAHHVDLDLDASTALRFHFGEFLLSIPWRVAQVLLIGATPQTLALWQRLTAAEVLFHHSNLRLPPRVEQWLRRVIVTPRLHGIHHSTIREERDSNFSSGLTVWDRLHGTIRGDMPQQEITIGVPPYEDKTDVTFGKTLLVPFVTARRQKKPALSAAPLVDDRTE
jgi:sterol desaturase/sphingolipid hydroxylase (fatty acid hydroxylase superfamily)